MAEGNGNSRLEAFSDGVFAIALTLLIIDIKVPESAGIRSTAGLWRALQHLGPSLFAFVLSFGIILITWVNHHGAMRLLRGSSPAFMYANGVLLLTVVFIPFPTALLGAFIWTDHAAPAVVLYDAVLAAQAIGWMLMSRAGLAGRLHANERAAATTRDQLRNAYAAFALYALLAALAFWWPRTVAAVTTLTWIFWLILGIRMKGAERATAE